MKEYRTERDAMGQVSVPAEAYFGAQTQRAVENLPISGWTMPLTQRSDRSKQNALQHSRVSRWRA